MDKIVTDPLYLKCKRMVETCNKNQTEMAAKYLELSKEHILKQVSLGNQNWIEHMGVTLERFGLLFHKLEELNG